VETVSKGRELMKKVIKTVAVIPQDYSTFLKQLKTKIRKAVVV
jgi:translation elongation factor EF-1beta